MSSSSQSLGLLAGAAFATFAVAYSSKFGGKQIERVLDIEEHDEEPIQAVPSIPSPEWPQSLNAALYDALSQNNGVFRTLDSAALVLKLARSLEPKLQIPSLDPFFAKLVIIEQAGMMRWNDFSGTKVVVVEGLAGSGKSTLIQGLLSCCAPSSSSKSARISSSSSSTPSSFDAAIFSEDPEVLNAKNAFSSMPDTILKAFEFASNYFTAYSIQQCDHKVAIIERFYHAICAHTICGTGIASATDLPLLHASSFDWPTDLPIPDLVMFLSVSTEQRMRRRKICGGTSSTDRSAERAVLRDRRLEAAYSLVTGPHTIAIDASGNAAETLTSAIEACAEYNVPIAVEKNSPKRISMGVYGAWS